MSSFDEVGEDYLGLGDAARLLGIAPQTLRRWADRGQIASYTTPGGHRRFPRSALTALAPVGRARRPTLSVLGAPADISRAYREHGPAASPTAWLAELEPDQVAGFRERGRRMAECLLTYLDAERPPVAVAALREAAGLASSHGASAAELGASLGQATQAFLRYRAPFVDELAALARRRGLDTGEATTLLTEAESAMDELLLAFIAGWQGDVS